MDGVVVKNVKTSITIGKSLDITHVSELSKRLCRSLKKSPFVEIKAANVEKARYSWLAVDCCA